MRQKTLFFTLTTAIIFSVVNSFSQTPASIQQLADCNSFFCNVTNIHYVEHPNFHESQSVNIKEGKFYLSVGFLDGFNYGNIGFGKTYELKLRAIDAQNQVIDGLNDISLTFEFNYDHPLDVFYIDITEFQFEIDHFEIYDVDELPYTGPSIPSESFDIDEIASQILVTGRSEFKYEIGFGELPGALRVLSPNGNFIESKRNIRFSWNHDNNEIYQFYEFQLLRLHNTSNSESHNFLTDERVIEAELDWSRAFSAMIELRETELTPGLNISFDVPIIEGQGYYAWRVKPVATFDENGINNSANHLNWSEVNLPIQNGSIYHVVENGQGYADGVGDALGGPFQSINSWPAPLTLPTPGDFAFNNTVFFFNDPDNDLNWRYKRVFSEGNRTYDEMIYADKLLNIRQTQTVNREPDESSINEALIVKQVVLDKLGRPALTSVPIPLLNFDPEINDYEAEMLTTDGTTDYSYKFFDYDLSSILTPSTAKHKGNYYDQSNPERVPEIQNYPMSRTRYGNDGLGRTVEQTGTDDTFFVGGKTIMNFYQTPSDEELLLIFGNEAPDAASVTKMITFDPNDVVSITYTNMKGELIASCLGFSDDENANLMSLENTSISTDDQAPTIELEVVDNMTTSVEIGGEFFSSKQIVLTNTGDLKINYDFGCQEFEQLDCYTANCRYLLKITVKSTSVDVNPPVFEDYFAIVSRENCNDQNPAISLYDGYDFDLGELEGASSTEKTMLSLAPGAYSIEKRLTPVSMSDTSPIPFSGFDDLMVPDLPDEILDGISALLGYWNTLEIEDVVSYFNGFLSNPEDGQFYPTGEDEVSFFNGYDVTQFISAMVTEPEIGTIGMYDGNIYGIIEFECCGRSKFLLQGEPISVSCGDAIIVDSQTLIGAGVLNDIVITPDIDAPQSCQDNIGDNPYPSFECALINTMLDAGIPMYEALEKIYGTFSGGSYDGTGYLKPYTPGEFDLVIQNMLSDSYAIGAGLPANTNDEQCHYSYDELFNCWESINATVESVIASEGGTGLNNSVNPIGESDDDEGESGNFQEGIEEEAPGGWLLKLLMNLFYNADPEHLFAETSTENVNIGMGQEIEAIDLFFRCAGFAFEGYAIENGTDLDVLIQNDFPTTQPIYSIPFTPVNVPSNFFEQFRLIDKFKPYRYFRYDRASTPSLRCETSSCMLRESDVFELGGAMGLPCYDWSLGGCPTNAADEYTGMDTWGRADWSAFHQCLISDEGTITVWDDSYSCDEIEELESNELFSQVALVADIEDCLENCENRQETLEFSIMESLEVAGWSLVECPSVPDPASVGEMIVSHVPIVADEMVERCKQECTAGLIFDEGLPSEVDYTEMHSLPIAFFESWKSLALELSPESTTDPDVFTPWGDCTSTEWSAWISDLTVGGVDDPILTVEEINTLHCIFNPQDACCSSSTDCTLSFPSECTLFAENFVIGELSDMCQGTLTQGNEFNIINSLNTFANIGTCEVTIEPCASRSLYRATSWEMEIEFPSYVAPGPPDNQNCPGGPDCDPLDNDPPTETEWEAQTVTVLSDTE